MTISRRDVFKAVAGAAAGSMLPARWLQKRSPASTGVSDIPYLPAGGLVDKEAVSVMPELVRTDIPGVLAIYSGNPGDESRLLGIVDFSDGVPPVASISGHDFLR